MLLPTAVPSLLLLPAAPKLALPAPLVVPLLLPDEDARLRVILNVRLNPLAMLLLVLLLL